MVSLTKVWLKFKSYNVRGFIFQQQNVYFRPLFIKLRNLHRCAGKQTNGVFLKQFLYRVYFDEIVWNLEKEKVRQMYCFKISGYRTNNCALLTFKNFCWQVVALIQVLINCGKMMLTFRNYLNPVQWNKEAAHRNFIC